MKPSPLFRCVGALVGLCVLLSTPVYAAKVPTDVVTLLYRKETAEAPNRLDPTIQAATRAIERALIERRYKVPMTPPEVLQALDRGPSVIVSFAPDAGFSLIFSVYRNLRPDPGINIAAAEVAISARVFVGSSLLSVEEGRSVMRTRVDDKLREFGERRAMELAAQRAAEALVEAIDERLRQLTPAQIEDYLRVSSVEETEIIELTPPSPQAAAPIAQAPNPPPPAAPEPPQIVIPADPPAVAPPPGQIPVSKSAKRHAIVIGVADYSQVARLNNAKVSNLGGVGTDVRNMASTLKQRGFAASDIAVLLDAEATTGRVTATLEAVTNKAAPEDLVAIYISGHGTPVNFKRQGMSMPVFYDTRFTQGDDVLDFEKMLELATRSNARRVVMIIDTCHAGGASSILPVVVVSTRGVSLSTASGGPAARALARAIPTTSDIAVLAAARSDELSIDRGARHGGLFTEYLAKGLLAAGERETLREIVANRVAKPVIEQSIQSCRNFADSGHPCPTGQQTPTLGFAGNGEQLRF